MGWVVFRHVVIRREDEERPPLLPHGVKGGLARVALLALVASVATFVPLQLLRWYQTDQVLAVLAAYEEAPRSDLSLRTTVLENGAVLIQGARGAGRDGLPEVSPYFDYDYLVAEFDSADGPIPFLARYDGSYHDLAFTWTGTVPQSAGGPVRLYFPAYYARWGNTQGEWTRYRGLELAPDHADRILSLGRVANPEEFTFLLTATLPPDWRDQPLYQQLTR